jgi:hypothetical protein
MEFLKKMAVGQVPTKVVEDSKKGAKLPKKEDLSVACC